MTVRKFPIEVVLAVTTGRPGVAPLDQVQELLSYMTGADIFMHQIPRAAEVCRQDLVRQHRWVDGVEPQRGLSRERMLRWVRGYGAEHGDELPVRVLPGGLYEPMDPIVEFTRRMGYPARRG